MAEAGQRPSSLQRPHERELPARTSDPDAVSAGAEKAPCAGIIDAGEIQRVSHPPLDSEMDSQQPPTAAAAGAISPWPGSNFKLDQYLADSVYLWACAERGEGDESPVSRSEALAAWFVLFTQAVAYAGLWWVSAPPSDPDPDPDDTRDYSIFAVSGAMYLMLSIAAADLWGCVALIFEGRSSDPAMEGFVLLTRRRLFGFALLATFLTLVGASIRVLFYSAFENVELVVGAATVLFVADVDEKAMTVLKNVNGEWCLFWVLEVVGLSVVLAVFAVKITGNGEALREDGSSDRLCAFSSCGVFEWPFVFQSHPTTATVVALLVSSAVSRPESSLAARVLRPPSLRWGAFSACVLCWVLWAAWASYRWADSESQYSVVPLAGCVIALALASAVFFRRHLKRAYTGGSQTFRGLDQRPRRYLLWGGVFWIVATFVLKAAAPVGDESADEHDTLVEIFGALSSLLDLAVDAWLVVGMGLGGLRSATHLLREPLGPDLLVAPLARSMLLGWGLSEAFSATTYLVFDAFAPTDLAAASYDLVELAWKLLVGTLLWGEEPGTFGVGYWTAASLIRNVVIGCGATWIQAAWFARTIKQVITPRVGKLM